MTHPSADRRAGGFTLLEVMLTVLIVGITITAFLGVRGRASNLAQRSANHLKALRYAEEIMTDAILSTDLHNEQNGVVEDDAMFRWLLTVEEFDLSTGRAEDDEADVAGGYGEFESAFVPADAGGEEEDDDENLHLVRRIQVIMTYPGTDEEHDEELTLENYVPRISEDNEFRAFQGNENQPR